MNQRVGFESFAEAAELLALSETRQPRVQSAQARQSPLTNVHVEVRGLARSIPVAVSVLKRCAILT